MIHKYDTIINITLCEYNVLFLSELAVSDQKQEKS